MARSHEPVRVDKQSGGVFITYFLVDLTHFQHPTLSHDQRFAFYVAALVARQPHILAVARKQLSITGVKPSRIDFLMKTGTDADATAAFNVGGFPS